MIEASTLGISDLDMDSLRHIAESIDSVVIEAYASKRSGDSVNEAADAAVTAAGYRAPGTGWRTLEEEESIVEMLAYYIGHDLAYASQQLLPADECEAHATSLVNHADPDAVWVTNWSPFSDWTFDMAFIAVGKHKTVFICFLAED